MSAESARPGVGASLADAPAPGVSALSVEGLSKIFDTTQVLHGVGLDVRPGEIHALVGENGSGKSTIVKILAGVYSAEAGAQVNVGGTALDLGNPDGASDAGLRFVHQDLGLIPTLDARDNLAFGSSFHVGRARKISWARETEQAKKALHALGYDIDVRVPVSTLSISERTAIAIARALSPRAAPAKVVVLDEPTANLPESEVKRLFASVRRLCEQGIGVLLITHHFEEIFEVADRATVLRDGHVVATLNVKDVDEGDLIELMIGRRLAVEARKSAVAADVNHDDTVLSVRGLTGEVLDGFDLDLVRGEVLGIAGITGSGREDVARLIVGDESRSGGTVSIGGRPVASGRPDIAKRMGVAYVPAERKANGILHNHSVSENVTIADVRSLWRGGFLRSRLERAQVEDWMTRLDVRPREPGFAIESLSGGNQQKVMLARSLRLRPDILVLDEPTQGVDVGAQAQIRRHIRESVKDGLSVIVCSSSSEELAEMCDRVIVLVDGREVAELTAPLEVDHITAATLTSSEEVPS
jgi:ribose transport system ATP-binding protein